MWIEIWKDNYRGVFLARMLWNTRQNTPEASILGVRLTEDTYRRLVSHTCSTAAPTTLPDEFRRWNRRALEAAAQRRAEAEGGDPSGVTTEDAEQEAEVSSGSDGGEDAESSGQAEHASLEADDAQEHPPSAEASDAEGGGEEDDSQANSDSVHSGSPGEHAETPAPANEPGDSQPED
eukprot:5016800-Pleurochrysis_carterae.AAC.1